MIKCNKIKQEPSIQIQHLNRRIKPLDSMCLWCVVTKVNGNKAKLLIYDISQHRPDFSASTSSGSQYEEIEIEIE